MSNENQEATFREEVETAKDLFLKGRSGWLRIINKRKELARSVGWSFAFLLCAINLLYYFGYNRLADVLFWVPWMMYLLYASIVFVAIRKRQAGYRKSAAYLNTVRPPENGEWTWRDMPGILKVAQL